LLEVVVLETLGLPVIVCVDFVVTVNNGLDDAVLLNAVLRVVVWVLVIVFVDVADNVPKFVAATD
jgi:hypothetical protein